MQPPETLTVFHYHLLRGGVRSAIERTLASLGQAGWLARRRVHVLTGKRQGTASFLRLGQQLGIEIRVSVDPRLDYRDEPWPDRKGFEEDAENLSRWFLAQAEGITLFWLHNVTLGKNPLVTAAWKVAARRAEEEQLPHRFIYHIHDFAECGRPQNLIRLRRCWQKGGIREPYPLHSNVGYAVLNRSDRHRLIQAGVPKQRVFYLPNVVSPIPAAATRRKTLIASYLDEYASRNQFLFDGKRPWWLLPIRLIRRKNVLEALVLGALAAEVPQLLLTLDANSAQERPYAEGVKSIVRRQALPMVIGFGLELVGTAFGFDELFAASEAIVSTSLLEGFGFTFLDGPMHGRPLVGRDLPDVTADFAEVGFPTHKLYNELQTPLEVKMRSRLLKRGRRFSSRMKRALSLPQSMVESFDAELETVYSGETVDFGCLDFTSQCALVARMNDRGVIADIRSLNPSLPNFMHLDDHFLEVLFARFGPQPHAHRFIKGTETLFQHAAPNWGETSIATSLLAQFFSPLIYKPLFGDW